MPELSRGLYDVLLTELLDRQLPQLPTSHRPDIAALRNAEAADSAVAQPSTLKHPERRTDG